LDAQPLRTMLVHVAVVAVFGVFLPWWLGVQFLDPVTIAAYSCLGVLFAAPAAAQAFAGEKPRLMSEAVTRIVLAALYGEMMAIAILIAGFTTILLTPARAFLTLDFTSLAQASALGLSGSIAIAAIAALIGMLLPPGASRMALRVIFLGLLMLFFFRSRWLPDVEVTGSLLCLAAAIGSLAALRYLIASRASAHAL
jgi:hypothetical protein